MSKNESLNRLVPVVNVNKWRVLSRPSKIHNSNSQGLPACVPPRFSSQKSIIFLTDGRAYGHQIFLYQGRKNTSRNDNVVTQDVLFYSDGKACIYIWSHLLPKVKICKITEKCSRFIIFKSRFLREKIIFFIQDFFPGKIWIYTFDCAWFYHISLQPAGIFQKPVRISLYFRKSSDFRKYRDIRTDFWNIPAGCIEIW